MKVLSVKSLHSTGSASCLTRVGVTVTPQLMWTITCITNPCSELHLNAGRIFPPELRNFIIAASTFITPQAFPTTLWFQLSKKS